MACKPLNCFKRLYNKCWGVQQIELRKIKTRNIKGSIFVQNPL